MSLMYSRITPFGFIDPKTATDEDNFYGEIVTLDNEAEEIAALRAAEKLRGMVAVSGAIQTGGLDSQSQAIDMAEALLNG